MGNLSVDIIKEDIEKIIENTLPSHIDLVYVDSRDSFDNNLKVLEQAIQEECLDPLYEMAYEQYNLRDIEWDEVLNLKQSVKNSIKEAFPSGDIDAIMGQMDEFITNLIYERDCSNPIKELLDNTSPMIIKYDLDLWLSGTYDEEDYEQIKKVLGIKGPEYDDLIKRLCRDAVYGGSLYIFFREDIKSLIKTCREDDPTHIEFKDPIVVIHDSMNGSGSHEYFQGLTIVKRLKDFKCFSIDEAHKYNYTTDICLMYHDWCDCTEVNIYEDPYTREIEATIKLIKEVQE